MLTGASGVHDWWPPGQGKEAHAPLDREHIALRYIGSMGLPVPRVLAAVQRDRRLGMVMTDLGEPDRDATEADAAEVAAARHRCPGSDALPVTGAAELAVMPQRIEVRALNCSLPPQASAMAGRLAAEARRLAAPAEDPPFGFVHSEWHPSSVIVRDGCRHTYDLARAFRGSGLIDLASWHGTITPADPGATGALIAAYVAVGGHPGALEPRAGLLPGEWALGWQRIWAVDWYCQQLVMGWVDGDRLPVYHEVIIRHLDEAVRLLRA